MQIPFWLDAAVRVLALLSVLSISVRFYETMPRVLVAPLAACGMMIAAYAIKDLAEPHLPRAIALSLEAIGRPPIVALALSAPLAVFGSARAYLRSLQVLVLVTIAVYVVGEVLINDFSQGFVQWVYVGMLGGYALCAVAIWKLATYSMAELNTVTPGPRG